MLTFDEFRATKRWYCDGHEDSGLEGPGWVYNVDGGHINASLRNPYEGQSCALAIENQTWQGTLREMERILYCEWYSYIEITRSRDKPTAVVNEEDLTVAAAIHRCLDDWSGNEGFSVDESIDNMNDIAQEAFEAWCDANGWDHDEQQDLWIKRQEKVDG